MISDLQWSNRRHQWATGDDREQSRATHDGWRRHRVTEGHRASERDATGPRTTPGYRRRHLNKGKLK